MKVSSRLMTQGTLHGDVRQAAVQQVVPQAPMSVLERLLEHARLVGRLMIDGRVSLFDRALVVAAIAYVISPLDIIPDVLPIIGQVDDVMVLVTVLTRLFHHAGRDVILSHWRGTPQELDAGWVKKLAFVFSFFFPKTSRQRLRRFSKIRYTP
ncbi:MAG: DUF1232 domain-containing protein [Gemmatimonadaceae bacterium]